MPLSNHVKRKLLDWNPKKKTIVPDIFQQMYAKICSGNHQKQKPKCMSSFGESNKQKEQSKAISSAEMSGFE
ncbi:hypothetical protein V6N13_011668 [Hibiscus sabdariffa]|uniref:Uncharacterized protein n=1 Tax=Hibiscus sabdariffa TaxID=183260 RepID=A0ABR2SCY1_9ROSI